MFFILEEGKAAVICEYIRLFSKGLLSTCYVLGTVLGKGDAEMSEIMRTLLHGAYILTGAENDN